MLTDEEIEALIARGAPRPPGPGLRATVLAACAARRWSPSLRALAVAALVLLAVDAAVVSAVRSDGVVAAAPAKRATAAAPLVAIVIGDRARLLRALMEDLP